MKDEGRKRGVRTLVRVWDGTGGKVWGFVHPGGEAAGDAWLSVGSSALGTAESWEE